MGGPMKFPNTPAKDADADTAALEQLMAVIMMWQKLPPSVERMMIETNAADALLIATAHANSFQMLLLTNLHDEMTVNSLSEKRVVFDKILAGIAMSSTSESQLLAKVITHIWTLTEEMTHDHEETPSTGA